ncbi:non-heme iron oxygenase ferredoxin subunit [Halomonas sp. V046]|uniref:non-heme iron oxygenase ferredoxin subunit n=1 Tax=Halomonas sp. V046 TaxID=3459611 RepID=UPI004044A64D
MSWTTVCGTDQVKEDFPFSAKLNDKQIGVYLLDGEYYALEDVCPHAYALLSQGFVEDGEVECPLHEATFDIKTGRCTREPADRDLHVYPVRIVEREVQLQINEEN